MAVDEKTFRSAMAQFVSGVTVVTTGHEGKRFGMTVASFTSLSLEPPLVLVCIERRVASHEAIREAGHFAVNFLSAEQQALSNQFASRAEDRFAGVATTSGINGDPLLDGALCTIECRLTEALPGGDHSIFVGEVLSAKITEAAPLVYFRSGYRELK